MHSYDWHVLLPSFLAGFCTVMIEERYGMLMIQFLNICAAFRHTMF
jgi:hypothetical protein